MIATIVPITSAPTAATTVNLMVIQNAASTLYSVTARKDHGASNTPPLLLGPTICRPQSHSHRTPETAAQGSGFGGLVEVSTLKPDGPTFASIAFCHDPSETIFSIAAFTLPHSSVSPFFRPTPYRSVENGLPTTLSLPEYCGCAAKPAKITLSVVTASTVPPTSASTHLE